MSIIALLSSLSWSVVGVLRGNTMRSGLSTLSGVFDQARQAAISKNSLVWVAFTEPTTETEDVSMVVIGSKGGTDPISGGLPVQMAGNTEVEVWGKIKPLPKIKIVDAGTVTLANLPGNGNTVYNSLATVSIEVPVGGKKLKFTRAVQFTPTGEAKVNASSGPVEMGIQPRLGGADAKNVAILRVAGVTGKINVYRPE